MGQLTFEYLVSEILHSRWQYQYSFWPRCIKHGVITPCYITDTHIKTSSKRPTCSLYMHMTSTCGTYADWVQLKCLNVKNNLRFG